MLQFSEDYVLERKMTAQFNALFEVKITGCSLDTEQPKGTAN